MFRAVAYSVTDHLLIPANFSWFTWAFWWICNLLNVSNLTRSLTKLFRWPIASDRGGIITASINHSNWIVIIYLMIKNFLCTVDCRVIDMYIHQIGHWNPHINIFLINTWQKYHIFTSDHPTCVCLPPRASAMHLNLHSDHIFSNMRNHSSLVVYFDPWH